jgi:CHASE2 domain-containing sensor protein/tRNA A-37 threonylcarbamoyl transferase component Bud32
MIKKFSGAILYALITVLVLSLYLDHHESLETIEQFLQDKMFLIRGEKEVPEDIVIVGIDDRTLESLGQWPWNRNKTARLIDAVAAQNPKSILVNLTFDPDEYQKLAGYTDSLAQTITKAGNVVLGYYYSRSDRPAAGSVLPEGLAYSTYRDFKNPEAFSKYPPMAALSLSTPSPSLANSAAGLGFFNVYQDKDRSIRWQPLIVGYRGEFLPSAHIAAAATYMGFDFSEVSVDLGNAIYIGNKKIPIDGSGKLQINYNGPEKTFTYFSASDIINKMVSPREFTGKMVLIGYTAFSSTDIYSTPVSRKLPGVELTANVLENIIHGNFLKDVTYQTRINIAVILVIGLFGALILPGMSQLNRIAVLALFMIILANLSYVLFSAFNTSLKFLYPGMEIGMLLLVTPLMKQKSVNAQELPEEEEELDYEKLLSSSSQSIPTQSIQNQTPMPHYAETVSGNSGTIAASGSGALAATATGSGTIGANKGTSDSGTMSVQTETESYNPAAMDHFGRYRLIEAIGKGAMGMVYKGLDPAIDRLVALKTIRLDQIIDSDESQELRERLQREAKAAGKLSHPNIVTIYDVGEESAVQYIAMEYLEGSTLEELMVSGINWDYKTLSNIMIQVCDALDYAHEHGIVHRDVKPANIMIMSGNRVKVMDFGIARLDTSASMTQTGTALGTPNYISPEQLKGQPVDRRSDIFSVGVVFYELLTVEKPFKGETLSALIYSILHTNPPMPSDVNLDVPRIFDKIIAKALVKDPDLRFQTARDMASILRKLV